MMIKYYDFNFMILSVPLSASIFLNLLLLHIFRDLSPYRPFQELFNWMMNKACVHDDGNKRVIVRIAGML